MKFETEKYQSFCTWLIESGTFQFNLPSTGLHGTNQKLTNLKDYWEVSSWVLWVLQLGHIGLSLGWMLWRTCWFLLGLLVHRVLIFSASKAPVTGYRRSWTCSSAVEHLASMCKVSLVELPAPKNKSRTEKYYILLEQPFTLIITQLQRE